MSKINRIRIMNLNYNGNAIRIDDETFDLSGETTLLSLRNGGGKTVLVQMVISLFVNKSYRDFEDRPFKSYFTTNKPTFIMTEWCLDNGQGYFLAGMMVRKAQNPEENNNEELEIINFTGSYRAACSYDLDNIPIIEELENGRVLKGFSVCKKEFEELKKKKQSDFNYYDMSGSYQRRMYFSKLKEYQIDNKEWESIIKKVNLKESGLSELFANAKDEKGLVENWFLDAVENKLNHQHNRIKEFQSLAYRLIRQYCANQTTIRRKAIIEQYFEDAAVLQKQIEEFEAAEISLQNQKSNIAIFIKLVNDKVRQLQESCGKDEEKINELCRDIRNILHEQYSYEIYEMKREKEELIGERTDSEIRIGQSRARREELESRISLFECARLYGEAQDFHKEKVKLQESISTKIAEQKDSEDEVNQIGTILWRYYNQQIKKLEHNIEQKNILLDSINKQKRDNVDKCDKLRKEKESLKEQIGQLKSKIENFDMLEENFNKRYETEISRNIVGEYEEGSTALNEKKFQDDLTQITVELTKVTENYQRLQVEYEELGRKSEEIGINIETCKYEQEALKSRQQKLEDEKNRRMIIMQYLDIAESEIDNKTLILLSLNKKIKELEAERDAYHVEKNSLQKEYDNLKQGKVVELPDNVIQYFIDEDIEWTYGMEWLKKNKRTVAENQKLVKNNPFLPYSIIVDKVAAGKLLENNSDTYTNFPIPVILKNELEESLKSHEGDLIKFDKVSFFVVFNKHLLDVEELQKILENKNRKIEELNTFIEVKKTEIDKYISHKNEIESQEFSVAFLQNVLEEIKNKTNEVQHLQQEYSKCKSSRRENLVRQHDLNEEINSKKSVKQKMQGRCDEYKILLLSYDDYLENRKLKNRQERKVKDIETDIDNILENIAECESNFEYEKAVVSDIKLQLLDSQKKAEVYRIYDGLEVTGEVSSDGMTSDEVASGKMSSAGMASDELTSDEVVSGKMSLDGGEDVATGLRDFMLCEESMDYITLESRYDALTKGISMSIDDLNRNLQLESERYDKKCAELKNKNKKYNFPEEKYRNLVYSYETIERMEEEKEIAQKEEDRANELNNRLEKKITSFNERIEAKIVQMLDKTGMDELVAVEKIVDTDFEARLKLTKYEKDKLEKSIAKAREKLSMFMHTQSVMAEYEDFEIILPFLTSVGHTQGTQSSIAIQNIQSVPYEGINLDDMGRQELNHYQGKLRADLKRCDEDRNKAQRKTADMVKSIASKEQYQEEFFKKGLDNLFIQADNVHNIKEQLGVLLESYGMQLERLKVDLDNIDRERTSVEETFMEYIRDIDDNLRQIDKNSTINIRGRSLKMLKIIVPDWNSNKEFYQLRLRDFVDKFIKWGLESIENDKNVEEMLGKIMTTKKLYDEIVGTGNIEIRMYKIEAEREIQISWAEVSANSGGEGFLSAFVILSCLLSYMRRDETDLFASGEEGKVLIMDNPFAQTNAVHLLKPLMDMAKKTNTQLICLSGLGGESIYNRFDNIYVLKLINSSMRQGMQYMDVRHTKGQPINKLSLSEFRMEQMSLFEIE